MLMTAIAQIKTNYRRLLAITMALAISVAFIQVSTMFSNTMKNVMTQALAKDVAKSDLVITPVKEPSPDNPFPTVSGDALSKSIGVENVKEVGEFYSGIHASFSGTSLAGSVTAITPEVLAPYPVVEGSRPTGMNEIMVDKDTASKKKIKPGDVIEIDVLVPNEKASTQSPENEQDFVDTMKNKTFTPKVTGVTKEAPAGAAALITASPDLIKKWGAQSVQQPAQPAFLMVKASNPNELEVLQKKLAAAVGPENKVLTQEQYTSQALKEFSAGAAHAMGFIWMFIAIAMVVAALVINNTYNVLLAQRTRELGLFRCLGAQSQQLKRSVLLEAAMVGIFSALVGTALSFYGFKALVHFAIKSKMMPEGTEATLGLAQAGIGIAFGIVLALIAAYVPARRATQTSPLEALRPLQEATIDHRQGKLKLISGFFLLTTGIACLAVGTFMRVPHLAIVGGIFAFLGLMMLSGLFIPALLSRVASIVPDHRVTTKLAALNTVRNPRRTASTATALMIGTTLVSAVMAGASTAKATINKEVDKNYSIDVIMKQPAANAVFDQAAFTKAQRTPHVEKVITASKLNLNVDGEDEYVYVSTPEEYSMVSRDPNVKPVAGSLLVSQKSKLKDSVKIQGPQGSLTIPVVKVPMSNKNITQLMITPETASQLHSEVGSNVLMMKTKDALPHEHVSTLQDGLIKEFNLTKDDLEGGLSMRLTVNTVVNSLMAVLLALLATSVVIAMIGIANTISLSVMERTRESSMLRALGLTKAQLRTTLAIEAVLISGIAALVSVVFGAGVGVLGTIAVLGDTWAINVALPWTHLALVFLVATGAGLLATVAPSRKAAKLSPVEGLAMQ